MTLKGHFSLARVGVLLGGRTPALVNPMNPTRGSQEATLCRRHGGSNLRGPDGSFSEGLPWEGLPDVW